VDSIEPNTLYSASSASSKYQNSNRGIHRSESTNLGANNLQQSIITFDSIYTEQVTQNSHDRISMKISGHPELQNGAHSVQYTPEPARHEIPPLPHSRAKKFNDQNQFTNAADVGMSFRRALQNVDHQRRPVQRLRDAVRDIHKRRKTTILRLSTATASLLKVLKDANLHAELREMISIYTTGIEGSLREAEDQDIAFDDMQRELNAAERKLKQTEISLYEQILWPLDRDESEVDTMHGVLSSLLGEQGDESIEAGAVDPTIAHVPSTIQIESKIREEVLMPLEFLRMEIVQGMSSQAPRLDLEEDEKQGNQSSHNTGRVVEIPQYMETLVAGPMSWEDRPLNAAADQLSRLLARKAQVRQHLSKIQADYFILQEDAQRRMAVGVDLDIYLEQYFDNYPHTCNLIQKDLADIEAKIAVCQQVVDRRDEQVPRVSRVFFHLDQFAGINTNHRPTELVIDDGEDVEAQWGTFEALASDLWPVSSIIPYPKYAKNWLSVTLDILRTHKEFLYAYVSFWFLKCLQASWLSFSRFIYYHYLDDTFASTYKSIKIRLLQSWFDKDLTISTSRSQSKPTGYLGASSLLTGESEFDEKTRKNLTKSCRSVGAQIDATLTPGKSTSWKGEGSFRKKLARSLTRSVRWQPRDDRARTL
jgi:hypothetical protein